MGPRSFLLADVFGVCNPPLFRKAEVQLARLPFFDGFLTTLLTKAVTVVVIAFDEDPIWVSESNGHSAQQARYGHAEPPFA